MTEATARFYESVAAVCRSTLECIAESSPPDDDVVGWARWTLAFVDRMERDHAKADQRQLAE